MDPLSPVEMVTVEPLYKEQIGDGSFVPCRDGCPLYCREVVECPLFRYCPHFRLSTIRGLQYMHTFLALHYQLFMLLPELIELAAASKCFPEDMCYSKLF